MSPVLLEIKFDKSSTLHGSGCYAFFGHSSRNRLLPLPAWPPQVPPSNWMVFVGLQFAFILITCDSQFSLYFPIFSLNLSFLIASFLTQKYCVFTYIYSLLIEKDTYDCQNISVKFLCVYMCLSSGDLFIFW